MSYRRHRLTINAHLLLPLLLALQVAAAACTSLPSQVQQAERTIAIADSMDAEHQLYSDAAALHAAIGTLCKPITRYLHRNTLTAAYYYMGRNLSANNAIPDAAECYIACDRLHPDDPIRRGRVNTCMAYICTWQCDDSLSLVFYKRSSLAFLESVNNTRYAHSLLSQCQSLQNLHRFEEADSLGSPVPPMEDMVGNRADMLYHTIRYCISLTSVPKTGAKTERYAIAGKGHPPTAAGTVTTALPQYHSGTERNYQHRP